MQGTLHPDLDVVEIDKYCYFQMLFRFGFGIASGFLRPIASALPVVVALTHFHSRTALLCAGGDYIYDGFERSSRLKNFNDTLPFQFPGIFIRDNPADHHFDV